MDIFTACWEGNADLVISLISSTAEEKGITAVTELLNAVDTGDEGRGYTPLHYAAYNGHKKIAELLTRLHAKVDVRNDSGCTPLYLAAQQCHPQSVKLLIQHGADPCIKDTTKGAGFCAGDVADGDADTLEAIASGARKRGLLYGRPSRMSRPQFERPGNHRRNFLSFGSSSTSSTSSSSAPYMHDSPLSVRIMWDVLGATAIRRLWDAPEATQPETKTKRGGKGRSGKTTNPNTTSLSLDTSLLEAVMQSDAGGNTSKNTSHTHDNDDDNDDERDEEQEDEEHLKPSFSSSSSHPSAASLALQPLPLSAIQIGVVDVTEAPTKAFIAQRFHVPISSATAANHSWSLDGLKLGRIYIVKIRGVNAFGSGRWSVPSEPVVMVNYKQQQQQELQQVQLSRTFTPNNSSSFNVNALASGTMNEVNHAGLIKSSKFEHDLQQQRTAKNATIPAAEVAIAWALEAASTTTGGVGGGGSKPPPLPPASSASQTGHLFRTDTPPSWVLAAAEGLESTVHQSIAIKNHLKKEGYKGMSFLSATSTAPFSSAHKSDDENRESTKDELNMQRKEQHHHLFDVSHPSSAGEEIAARRRILAADAKNSPRLNRGHGLSPNPPRLPLSPRHLNASSFSSSSLSASPRKKSGDEDDIPKFVEYTISPEKPPPPRMADLVGTWHPSMADARIAAEEESKRAKNAYLSFALADGGGSPRKAWTSIENNDKNHHLTNGSSSARKSKVRFSIEEYVAQAEAEEAEKEMKAMQLQEAQLKLSALEKQVEEAEEAERRQLQAANAPSRSATGVGKARSAFPPEVLSIVVVDHDHEDALNSDYPKTASTLTPEKVSRFTKRVGKQGKLLESGHVTGIHGLLAAAVANKEAMAIRAAAVQSTPAYNPGMDRVEAAEEARAIFDATLKAVTTPRSPSPTKKMRVRAAEIGSGRSGNPLVEMQNRKTMMTVTASSRDGGGNGMSTMGGGNGTRPAGLSMIRRNSSNNNISANTSSSMRNSTLARETAARAFVEKSIGGSLLSESTRKFMGTHLSTHNEMTSIGNSSIGIAEKLVTAYAKGAGGKRPGETAFGPAAGKLNAALKDLLQPRPSPYRKR